MSDAIPTDYIMARFLLALLFLSPSLCASEDLSRHDSSKSVRLKDTACTTTGYKCSSDCTKLEVCISQSDTELISEDVRDCAAFGQICDENIKNCSQTLETCPVPFICTSKGTFPDPYVCTQYHICVDNAQDIKVTCLYGTAFDPSTEECSLKTTDNPAVCRHSLVPDCNYEGQSGPLEWNAKFYYKCVDGKVVLYKCGDEEEFDSTTQKCTSASSSTQSTTTSVVPYVCGNSTVYADPDDCGSYYLCEKNLSPQRKQCPTGTDYSPLYYACLPESSVCGTTSPSYTCAIGGFYPDLLNCNRYYACLLDIAPVLYTCLPPLCFDSAINLCGTACCGH